MSGNNLPRTCLGSLCLIVLSSLVQGVTVRNSTAPVPTYTWLYNASSSIDQAIDIHTNASGTAFAFACQSASQSWLEASSSVLEEASSTWPVVPLLTSTWSETQEFWDIWTTDCDGITHARGATPTSTTVFATSTVWTSHTITPSYTLPPQPSCIIQPSDCKAVLESWSVETSALSVWESHLTVPFYVTNRPAMPSCTTICTSPPECMIMADHVELIYWPVTTTGANSCRANGTTVSESSSELRTIVTLGTTFTSPTPYLSFRSISAWDWACNTQISEGVSGTIIPISPGQLSSARGWHLGRSAYSFNLADLNGFITSAAYFQMQAYDWSGARETIFDDLYYPTVWLPDIVTELRPEWKTCSLSPFGVNDPPIALTSVAYLAPTTTKAPIQTPGYKLYGSARPGATPTSTGKASVLPTQHDPLATATRATQPEQSAEPESVPIGAASIGGMFGGTLGGYIASALGLLKPAPAAPATSTVLVVFGKGGFRMHNGQSRIPPSDVVGQMTSRAATQMAAPATITKYAIAYETAAGHAADIGEGMTLSVGGPATEVDGYVVSAAASGLVLGGVTIPFAADVGEGMTLSVGGPATEIDGHVVSATASGLVLGGVTIPSTTDEEVKVASSSSYPDGSITNSADTSASGTPSHSGSATQGAQTTSTSLANQTAGLCMSLAMALISLAIIMSV